MDLNVGMLALGKEQIKRMQTTEMVFFGAVER
jgi:aminopeptidase C